jgi:AbrB family looped-hinge helix DNA binding protein
MQSTLTSKGQITIPVALRRKLNLKTGDVLNFDENAPFLKASKEIDVKRMRSAVGRMKKDLKGKSVKEWMEWLRGPSDYLW